MRWLAECDVRHNISFELSLGDLSSEANENRI